MKILLLSDTHGDVLRIDEVLDECGKLDLIIHCGDIDSDCDYIERIIPADVAFLSVRGNNDWHSERPYSMVQELDGIRFYITHGHREKVKTGSDSLIRAAKMQNCTVALHGHTHRPLHTTEDGIQVINPGALSYPVTSYAVLYTDNGKLTVYLKKI